MTPFDPPPTNRRRFVDPDQLRRFAREALVRRRVADPAAADTAAAVTFASVRGTDSHGLRLLAHYIQAVEEGRINPTPTVVIEPRSHSTAIVDGDHGLGHHAGRVAMDEAIRLARYTGAGHVSVRNSSHCGAMAWYGLRASDSGMLGICMTHASPNMSAPNSTHALVSTNPICICAPANAGESFCYDGSQSHLSFNEVRRRRDHGEDVPPRTCLDSSGVETTDAHRATTLRSIGAHKGFGLAMAVDIICGALTGMPMGPDVSSMRGDQRGPRRLGHYFCAIDIARLHDLGDFQRRLEAYFRTIRDAARRVSSVPIMVPGDPEQRAAKRRARRGIPVDDHAIEQLDRIADAGGQRRLNYDRRPRGE